MDLTIKIRCPVPKYAKNDADVSVTNIKKRFSDYAFVIIVLKMASRSPNLAGKKWHPLFFTKSSLCQRII